jgi:excisionase family DNA binding protein
MAQNKKTVGIREAARALGFTVKYIYDLVHSGRLPAQKIDRQWRIALSAVEGRLKARGE